MSHGLKALLLAASTIITCIIVGLGFMTAREAKQIGNYMVDELHRYRTTIEEQDYTKYDGATVYGNDVVNLMKKELSEEKGEISITVEADGMVHSYRCKADMADVQEIGTSQYISPVDVYTAEVIRNRNEVITEIIFRKRTEDNNDE